MILTQSNVKTTAQVLPIVLIQAIVTFKSKKPVTSHLIIQIQVASKTGFDYVDGRLPQRLYPKVCKLEHGPLNHPVFTPPFNMHFKWFWCFGCVP